MQRTTTLIKPDGTQERGFQLQYKTDCACAIPDEEAVIITGGSGSDLSSSTTTVSMYTVQGWQRDLPPLNTNRYWHACSSYMSDEKKILLVSGGFTGSATLDSTEILDTSVGSWKPGAALPSPIQRPTSITINNRVFIFGGGGGDGSDAVGNILEYDTAGDSYKEAGTMVQARYGHALTVVHYEEFSNWCQ